MSIRISDFRHFPFFLPLSKLGKKIGKHGGTFFFQHPSGHLTLMIELFHLQDVEYGPGAAGFRIHAADHDSGYPGLYYSTGAHLTRFQCYVHGTILQPPVSGMTASLPHRQQLCMSQYCFFFVPFIVSPGYDPVLADDNTADGDIPYGLGFLCLADRLFHELLVLRILSHFPNPILISQYLSLNHSSD